MNHFERVSHFNKEILGINPASVGQLDDNTNKLLGIQLREEISEYEEAVRIGDFPAQIDGIVDLIYFAYGALYKMGLTPDTVNAIEDVVHECNMQKKAGVKAARGDQGAVDAVKTMDCDPMMAIIEIIEEQTKEA